MMNFPKNFLLHLILVVMLITVSAWAVAPQEYGFLYWEYGWRGKSLNDERVLSVLTSHYGASFDVEKATLIGLGAIASPLPYAEAVSDIQPLPDTLPAASLTLEVVIEDTVYKCSGADLHKFKGLESPSRLIETGRYLQRFDIQELCFKSESGALLAHKGRLEVVAWPESLHLLLEMSDAATLPPCLLRITLTANGETIQKQREYPKQGADETPAVSLQWQPKTVSVPSPDRIEVKGTQADDTELSTVYDVDRHWHRVALPAAQFSLADDTERTDSYPLYLKNHGETPVKVPLLFSLEGAFSGITGMSAMLLDAAGNSTGIPVQISKNWHRQADKPELYEGPWFHGFTMISLEPGETWEGALQLVYAWWEGKPAVSHAQLCLIGWGTNQLWDQVAIGSWGETICYDPDINLNRSMIDDVRPLMVHGMGSTAESPKRWTWTNNVGGGDFLVYRDMRGIRVFPAHMRTAYLNGGPVRTETIYSGVTQDGTIKMRITASTPSCDDVARAYHHLRYDVLKPTPFSRLAFYQLGADNYNDHQFNKLARGNKDGLLEEWTFDKGGEDYDRKGVLCEGDAPWWFSMHDALPRAPQGGAWANRGLIVREWKAQLGDHPVDKPYVSFFGTNNGIPSMNVELSPPPTLEQLEPGDFVEAFVELVVVPMYAEEYYGPNQEFREHLQEHENSWQPVHRLAIHNE